ncbi:MAG: hypothetical protein R3320_14560, partial [Nitriliruptorales bacterium]|nr:hypothetical protein [Nitriliruptorales bacterium]
PTNYSRPYVTMADPSEALYVREQLGEIRSRLESTSASVDDVRTVVVDVDAKVTDLSARLDELAQRQAADEKRRRRFDKWSTRAWVLAQALVVATFAAWVAVWFSA